MSLLAEILRTWGAPGVRKLIVVIAFLVVPVGVWWAAMPMISTLPLPPAIQTLLTWAVVGTALFGAASGVLVWRDLDAEP
ncbi:MAG: hypothetical protein R3F61_03220 [Myxococcota bacterium]